VGEWKGKGRPNDNREEIKKKKKKKIERNFLFKIQNAGRKCITVI